MVVLMLRFPGRRYHATPWGHHVNEGLIEWPPSPWRVLRALLSVGYSALGWDAPADAPWQSQPPATARALIDKLASVLPRYRLPPAVGTHSRHYMPKNGFDDPKDKSLVFDTWAQVDDGELGIAWDVALDADETALLSQLATHLPYLGRSESWVQARLLPADQVDVAGFDVQPCEASAARGTGWEQVALLAPMPAADYASWRAGMVEQALTPLPLPDTGRKAPKPLMVKRVAAAAPFPESLLACLQTDTTWQRSFGWSQPPGSRKLLYWRRSEALSAPTPAMAPVWSSARSAASVPFVLLALATPSGNLHALPALARSLPQGEMLHRQAVGARQRLAPHDTPRTLGGCDAQGRPRDGAHGHAHVLSLDLDGDDHIDHLLVWAPDGLDSIDQQALRRTRGTYTKGGVGDLRLAWAGAGSQADLMRLAEPFGSALRRALGRSTAWISTTPFVPPRFLKPNGRHTLLGQVQAELASRGLPAASDVEVLDPHGNERARRQRHHVRQRRHGPQPPVNCGFTLRLRFDCAVSGPLCLGYGSHFGLGRFEHEASPDPIHESVSDGSGTRARPGSADAGQLPSDAHR